uniref:Ferredoxin n=1 Tax=Fibrocapsa japonica TaxID=94617 RepID=A0A7S2V4F7_9STRA|mmetsp:Transcript_684/g.1004  ORF Transcript_684/g.1004 Transcript_684/m.1004 type:complete len:154 (+) Transcript_684:100-561(+)
MYNLKQIVLLLGVLAAIAATGEGFATHNLKPVSWRSSPSSLSRQRLVPKAHQVTIQHEGKDTVLEVDESTTILEAALDAGIDLPHDCQLGVCLTCPSRIVSGEVDQGMGTLDDSVVEQGFALTCISYPRSDCVVRSVEEDEMVNAQFADRVVG